MPDQPLRILIVALQPSFRPRETLYHVERAPTMIATALEVAPSQIPPLPRSRLPGLVDLRPDVSVVRTFAFLYPRRVQFFSTDPAFDISKADDLPGCEPSFGLEEGLR